MRDNISGVVTPKQTVTGQLTMADHVGGTRNYNDLENKPSIEGVELVGDKTLEELNINRYLRNYPSETRVVQIVNTAIGQIAIPVNTSDLVNDSDFQTGDDVIDAIAGAISGLDIPTRTSDLINDSNYQTSDDVDGAIDKALEDLLIPTKTSDLTNDSGFQTANDVDTAIGTAISGLDIPEKVSDLTNDSGFQTAANVSDAINTAVGQLDIPTKVSDLTNDSGFQTASDVQLAIAAADIPTALSDLTNDMTFQTLTEITNLINDAIGSAVGLNFEVVQTLPATGEGGTIYLVPNGGSAVVRNVYDEYVWYNGQWEKIGTTEIDLSNVLYKGSTFQNNKALMTDASGNAVTGDTTATELNYVHGVTSPIQTQLNGKQDTLTFDNVPTENSNNPVKSGGVYSALADKVNKVTGKGLSTNDYTNADKAIVDGVTAALAEKADASDVPTALSDLTDDATHRLVTDTEKATWNGKANSSDIPTDLADLTADSTHRTVTDAEKTAWNNKADAEDIPTKTSDLTNDSGFATASDLADKQDVFQYDTMPTASADNVGDIVQFIGATTASYTNGYFYKCVEESGSYSWVQTDVQPSSGGGGASESEIAPVESTSTASKAYAVGDLLIYDGKLYRVTAAIASGGTITPGTNVTETSVSEVFVRKTGDTMTGPLETTVLTVGSRLNSYSIGTNSVAEGTGIKASGAYSHGEGYFSVASGFCSHVEGSGGQATAECSHAEGVTGKASGKASHAEGSHTVAGYDYQHVQGKYNDNKSANAFEIGNGTDDNAKSNALEVTWDGDLTAAGDITDGQGNSLKGTNGNLATIETTTTASQTYAIGDYLVYSGQLYKVTTAIASGGTIVVTGSGANVAATTVISAINDMVGLALTASY